MVALMALQVVALAGVLGGVLVSSNQSLEASQVSFEHLQDCNHRLGIHP